MGDGVSHANPSNSAHRRPASKSAATAISMRTNGARLRSERISLVNASMWGPASAETIDQA